MKQYIVLADDDNVIGLYLALSEHFADDCLHLSMTRYCCALNANNKQITKFLLTSDVKCTFKEI